MTEEQFKILLNAVNNNQKSDSTKMMDNLVKVAIALLLGATTWIFSSVQNVSTETAVMSSHVSANTEKLNEIDNKVDAFTVKPRFTQDDFTRQMSPFISELNNINEELDDRKKFMSETENKFQSLELKMSVLKNK
ncbi:MAG: hypothetical protein AAF348_07450 [Bacteroidota bacterium]